MIEGCGVALLGGPDDGVRVSRRSAPFLADQVKGSLRICRVLPGFFAGRCQERCKDLR